MNTLYLSYDGMTDPLGQSQVLPYLCGLLERSYRITLVSFEKKEAYAREKVLIEDICRKASIDWRPQPYGFCSTPTWSRKLCILPAFFGKKASPH